VHEGEKAAHALICVDLGLLLGGQRAFFGLQRQLMHSPEIARFEVELQNRARGADRKPLAFRPDHATEDREFTR
jgi:hypothetical protein